MVIVDLGGLRWTWVEIGGGPDSLPQVPCSHEASEIVSAGRGSQRKDAKGQGGRTIKATSNFERRTLNFERAEINFITIRLY